MRKQFRTVAVMALLTSISAGCQKKIGAPRQEGDVVTFGRIWSGSCVPARFCGNIQVCGWIQIQRQYKNSFGVHGIVYNTGLSFG